MAGVPIFRGGLAAAVAFVLERIASGRGARIATANLDFLAQARKNGQLLDDLRACDCVVADGMPVAWLARLAGAPETRRIPGVDLVEALCGARAGLRVAMYGSSPAIAGPAAEHLKRSFGANVVSLICPPFRPLTDAELQADLAAIAAAEPEAVLVALGCPRQERFIASAWSVAPRAAWLGVGGTFDFYAGRRTRAPRAVQSAGLEWLVRLVQEPRRLGGRYLVRDVPALLQIAPRCLLTRAARFL